MQDEFAFASYDFEDPVEYNERQVPRETHLTLPKNAKTVKQSHGQNANYIDVDRSVVFSASTSGVVNYCISTQQHPCLIVYYKRKGITAGYIRESNRTQTGVL